MTRFRRFRRPGAVKLWRIARGVNFNLEGCMRSFPTIFILLPAMVLAKPTTTPNTTAAKAAGPAAAVVTPDKIQWGPAPPVFPAGAQMAVLAGNPGKAGPFTVRLKFPDGYRVMPHWHPTAENVTVLSGEFR